MNVEISQRIRFGWKTITVIKDMLKVKLYANLFNSTILPVILYASEKWVTIKKEEEVGYSTMLWKDPCWEYYCMRTSKDS